MNEHSQPTPPDRLAYNAAEAAAVLGISDTSLWRLEKRGLLKPVKHLRHRIYARTEIERFLRGGVR